MDPEVYKKTIAVQEMIIKGDIKPPHDEATYNEFVK